MLNEGFLATVTDSDGFTTKYYYDFTNRLMKYVESGEDYSHSVAYTYDTMNNLTALVETINGTEFVSSYGYNDDNVLTSVTNGSQTWAFEYDSYGRLSGIDGSPFDRTYNYHSVSDTQLTAQLSSIGYPSSLAGQTYAYTYDDNGNIVSVTFGDDSYSYVYDSQNQLIRENNSQLGRTYTWTYDNAGNILSRSTYAYTTGELGTPTATIQYRYEDADWGDLLTGIASLSLTYDEIGNMLTFGPRSFTWEHGRQLESQTVNGVTWTYSYDMDGMRTGRTNGTTSYEYIYNGSQLMRMIRNGVVVDFTYINGIPATLSFGGNTFYYVVNGQGDVTGITDSQGNLQITYYYDAWGSPYCTYDSSTSPYAQSLYNLNPLLYRGYVFDWEVGLYYLQSRYYIPEIGRFLSADVYISTGQGFIGSNMYAYCNNSAVNAIDPTGEDAIWLQDTDNVYTMGHTGLLLQDEDGEWHHFYWGTDSKDAKKGLSPRKAWLEDYGEFKSLRALNDYLDVYDIYPGSYEKYIYFSGDFDASVKYMYSIRGNYNLALNNCMQVSLDVLRKGKFTRCNAQYKAFLLKLRMNPIPNVAYRRMCNFKNAIGSYYAAPWWLRKFYISPWKAVGVF